VLDRLGRWFTLACFGGARPSEAIVAAAARRGVPLAVLHADEPNANRVYGASLLLVRPDQHIAWRGRDCDDPRVADTIIARALGWEERT
jgi:hypothetical protein